MYLGNLYEDLSYGTKFDYFFKYKLKAHRTYSFKGTFYNINVEMNLLLKFNLGILLRRICY